MVLLGQFDRRIGERAAALIRVEQMRFHSLQPAAQLRSSVVGVGRRELVPELAGIRGEPPQVLSYLLVLGREVPVERHLVGAGGLGNRLDSHSSDAESV